MKFTYRIEGMHCVSCIDKINTALSPHIKIVEITLNPPKLQIEAEQPPSLKDLNAHLTTAGKYRLIPNSSDNVNTPSNKDQQGLRIYYPIFLIASYIILVASINSFHGNTINWQLWMQQFMAGFFFVFSAFKLLDLRGFAEGYATYDLLAKYWYGYGYIYPFLELSLGILFLTSWLPTVTPLITIIIMGFSSLGVINSLIKGQKIKCACLGTLLNVPLSSITLIEDLTMVGMAALTLMMR